MAAKELCSPRRSVILVLLMVLGAIIAVYGFHSQAWAHVSLGTYEGSKSCSPCHPGKAAEVHSSAHYQWQGPTPSVPNLKGQIAGKWGSINDFCTYPNINLLFEMTNLAGATVVTGCGACHVGLGKMPSPEATPAQLDNIDCLLCHSDLYKRKGAMVNGAPGFVTDPTVNLAAATAAIQLPSRATCLTRCHVGAGGGPGFKQGDIDPLQADPPKALDVHMASVANGGAGLSCLDCHTASGHRIAGRGNDIRETDLNIKVDCLNCHTSTPHANQDINRHTTRVHCSVCHIPALARNAATDILRDFTGTEADAATNRYEPLRTFATNVLPAYRWFNGLSYFYEFGKPMAFLPGNIFMQAGPLGTITDTQAKIHPFKVHQAKLGYDVSSRRQIPVKSKVLWETGDVDQALKQGAAEVGWSVGRIDFADSIRYFSLSHEVAPKENALQCSHCHVSAGRLNFKELGYLVKTSWNGKPLCASCHSPETADFYQIHNRHVHEQSISCTTCHTFLANPLIPPAKVNHLMPLLLVD